MTRQPLITACAVAAVACLMPAARAADLVTLRNGFQMRCDHYAAAGDHARLYLTAGEDNYIEVLPSEIAAVSQVTDPVPDSSGDPLAAASDSAHASASANSPPAAALTPADLKEMLSRAGQRHNLDVDLLASVVHAESDGNPRAVSRAGARGLMQLMPATAASMGVQNSFQPQQNVSGGSAYLDELLTRYGNNLALALAAYNAGPDAVNRYHGIPPYPETQAYVARVIHEFNRRVLAREAAQRRTPAGRPILHPAVSRK